MIKIKLVVPGKDYIQNAHKIFLDSYEEERTLIDHEQIDFELEEVVVPVAELPNRTYEADVIISRGLLTKKLKKLRLNIPIVDIPVQGIDLVRSLFLCRSEFGKRKVAVIGADNMIYGADNLGDIVDLEIEQYYLKDVDDILPAVEKAKADGCEVVLAGIGTCAYARKLGLHAKVIQTTEDSFHQALNEAKRLAVVGRKEAEKTRQYQTILDNAYEGVIAIDLNNKITAFNEAAQLILKAKHRKLFNREVTDVLAEGELVKLLVSDENYKEAFIKYGSIQLSVKKVAILLRDKKVGDMIAFQDITGIQEMEGKIRKQIYLRGHVAKHTFDDIISESDIVKQTIEKAKSYSAVDSNILIIGESGTGKEMYTQSIHSYSPRKSQPFVAINCAALPENLLESELFGYVEGAFTGAAKGGKQGFFELAHKGTLFLDEIGEITPSLQSRLLRVLQEREVMRIGDDKVIPVDVRIIAATNKNLLEMVKENTFREDLYYRLSVLDLHLPPLRASHKDIPLLAASFIQKFNSSSKPIIITDEALQRLSEEKWEGNVRQLQNVCERLTVLCKNDLIDLQDVEQHLPKDSLYVTQDTYLEQKATILGKNEKEKIIQALQDSHFHRETAAEKLGMSRTTLWRKLKQYNIKTN